MGAPKTRTEYMSFEVTANVRRVCFGDFSGFYVKYIQPCGAFSKIEFGKAMRNDLLSPKKYRAVVFALMAATDKINAERSDPAHRIPPLVPEDISDPLVGPNIMEYLEITKQGQEAPRVHDV